MIKNFRMRKTFARILLPFLVILLCVTPLKSFALVPLGLAPALYGGASAGGTAVGSGISAWSLLLGAAFAFIGVSDSNGNQVRIPLTSDPTKAVPEPVMPPPQAVIPAHSEYQFGITVGLSPKYSSFCGAVDARTHWRNDYYFAAGVYGSATAESVVSCSDSSLVANMSYCDPVCGIPYVLVPANFTVTTSSESCQPGYMLNGSECIASDPRVEPDGNCDYQRVGSALSVLSDPDCGGGAQLMNCNVDGSVCSLTGRGLNGNPYKVTITTNPTGGSDLVFHEQRIIDNTTVVDTVSVNVSSSGIVSSASGVTNQGSINVDDGAVSQGSTVNPTPTPQPTPSPTINFPSDYARQGEAQTAANSIKDNLDSHLKNTDTQPDPADLTAADSPGYGTTFDGIKNWSVPSHTSVCPQPSMDLSMVLGAGHTYTMSAHCQLVQDHFATLRAAMLVCWAIAALFVVLRA